MTNRKVSTLMMYLNILFVVCMLISNIIASKQFAIGPYNVPGGTIVFPITYILSDVFSEVYGYKESRKQSWLGFGANLFMVLIFELAIVIPAPPWYGGNEAFNTILGNTPRLLIAGLAAYIIGGWMDDLVFRKMKSRYETSSKGFGVRAILSSLVGEIFDSCIFVPAAFLGVIEGRTLVQMIILQVICKTAYEIVILPITQIVVKKVKTYEKMA